MSAEQPRWKAGLARVVITPDAPMWLAGYGGAALLGVRGALGW